MGVCQAEFLPPGALEEAGLCIADEVRGIQAVLRKAGDLCHEHHRPCQTETEH